MTSTFNPGRSKLSQWDALSLESLRRYGWKDEELIRRVQEGDLPKDASKFQFDYAGLKNLAHEQSDIIAAALGQGYQVKYSTLRGIQSWLLLALDREAEVHAVPGREAVTVLLTAAEAERLASVLSYGWSVELQDRALRNGAQDAEECGSYVVAPIERGPVIE
ncbi:hypothetical protein [Paenibacillus methanolicus]|uniref:Uncharacterized protein n=1 Tax=Paenibacillus methanolicus TaxID=582686 RepID=A0A5S5CDP4_9BACL|nr:hypothetical protein [Paenibacillus methanolicus]TYP76470.1 hypothetical protein BCM02_103132 [Paenibacillus methanolicus]